MPAIKKARPVSYEPGLFNNKVTLTAFLLLWLMWFLL